MAVLLTNFYKNGRKIKKQSRKSSKCDQKFRRRLRRRQKFSYRWGALKIPGGRSGGRLETTAGALASAPPPPPPKTGAVGYPGLTNLAYTLFCHCLRAVSIPLRVNK